ncbi:hypothetical protein BHE74_00014970 [Ensete ventricosum]|nr:hypothetical protein GW17_00054689 [Ensete ventricosum]RWW76911.1 hypothetical protein BHE74_00014970 [Ensete ventricosum]
MGGHGRRLEREADSVGTIPRRCLFARSRFGVVVRFSWEVEIVEMLSPPPLPFRLVGTPLCGWHQGRTIVVIPHLRPAEYKRSRLSRNRRTVNRAYGGVLSGSAVRERL